MLEACVTFLEDEFHPKLGMSDLCITFEVGFEVEVEVVFRLYNVTAAKRYRQEKPPIKITMRFYSQLNLRLRLRLRLRLHSKLRLKSFQQQRIINTYKLLYCHSL